MKEQEEIPRRNKTRGLQMKRNLTKKGESVGVLDTRIPIILRTVSLNLIGITSLLNNLLMQDTPR